MNCLFAFSKTNCCKCRCIIHRYHSSGRSVTPYVLDLGSANGTFVNNQRVEPKKYVQVMERDVLKFGFSSREYVLLHDQSKECEEGDPGVD